MFAFVGEYFAVRETSGSTDRRVYRIVNYMFTKQVLCVMEIAVIRIL